MEFTDLNKTHSSLPSELRQIHANDFMLFKWGLIDYIINNKFPDYNPDDFNTWHIDCSSRILSLNMLYIAYLVFNLLL